MIKLRTEELRIGDRVHYWFGFSGHSDGEVVGFDDDLILVRDDYSGFVTPIRQDQLT